MPSCTPYCMHMLVIASEAPQTCPNAGYIMFLHAIGGEVLLCYSWLGRSEHGGRISES